MTIRLKIERLDWDEWNREHIARHGVHPEDVEAALNNVLLVKPSYKGRLIVICSPPDRRVLAVVIGETPGKPGTYYVFSARSASRKERRELQQEHES